MCTSNQDRVERGEDPLRFRFFARNLKSLSDIVRGLNEERSCRLTQAWPAGAEICGIADLRDAVALDTQISQLSSVVSYAGPFSQCGEHVLSSCVRCGVHYLDVTAELNWVKRMELKYGAAARERKVKLVSCCGFDFLPTDLGMLQLEMLCEDNKVLRSWGGLASLKNVVHGFSQSTPMVSGGTAWSAIWILKSMGVLETLKWYVDPHGICNTRPGHANFNNLFEGPTSRSTTSQDEDSETTLAWTERLSKWWSTFTDRDCFILPKSLDGPAERNQMTEQRRKRDDDLLQEALLDSANMPSFWGSNVVSRLINTDLNKLTAWWRADYCVNFVMSMLMMKYLNWRMEVSNKPWGRRAGLYYGGEIRRNYLWACFWSVMVWVGFFYVCLVSLLPLQYATYFVPKVGGGSHIDPDTAFMYTHMRAEFPQGRVHLKWRLLKAETYIFAARSSIVAAVILAQRKHNTKTLNAEDSDQITTTASSPQEREPASPAVDDTPRVVSSERYGFLPASIAIGPELLTEMAKRTNLEIAAPEIESYC